jgi:universal stress protein E
MPFRIRSILVASDLSDRARDVVRTAGAFAALTEAELHVVYAAEGTVTTEASGRDPAAEAAGRLREQLRQALPRDAKVTSLRVDPGRAHEVILRRAREVHADLIVVGPHRERLEARQVLGTTADRIVRTSDQPCLIVHRPVSLPLRRVLVPSDLSDAARGALDLALIWAAALRLPARDGEETRVDVLHVLPELSVRTEAERALQDQVTAAGERTGCAALLTVNELVVAGDAAADQILRRAGEVRADLLVLGTHGESALSRALIGSVRPPWRVGPSARSFWSRRNGGRRARPARRRHGRRNELASSDLPPTPCIRIRVLGPADCLQSAELT